MWLLIYSFLIGDGAARLPEPRPLTVTEERVVRPPPGVRDPTVCAMVYGGATASNRATRKLEIVSYGCTATSLQY